MVSPYRLYGGATRPDAISGLDPAFEQALEALYAAAPPEVRRELGLTSGYRDIATQQRLWDASDKTGRTVARPGHSKHNMGLAADLFGFGLKGGGAVSDATKQWVHANAGRFGLGFPMDYEPWHIQMMNGGSGSNALVGGAGGDQLNPQQQWMAGLWQYAQAASAKTGVDPRVIMAQAALETGYGKSAPNNNYFGIKGPGEGQQTLEFINGRMQPVTSSFRTYKDPEESFNAYANFLMGDRYAGVRGAKGLEAQIEALGKSGYATDPDYAKKILAIAQGIPEGGFGAGGAGSSSTGSAGGSTSPYSLPLGDKKADAKKRFGEALANAVAGMGGGGGQYEPQLAPEPAAARADAEVSGIWDPQAAEANRQYLAQMLAQLNQSRTA